MRFSTAITQASAIALLSSFTSASPVSEEVVERSARVTKPHPNSVFLRVEGATSTIYEGEVLFPFARDVTTPSGGTHKCDGTNYGANPSPGPTCTSALDQASQYGRSGRGTFPFDGTWSDQFDDFFITSIGDTTQGNNQYWGVLINEVYTPTGGCQSEVAHGQRAMWAFNVFSKDFILTTSGRREKVLAGTQFTVQVERTNPNDGSQGVAQGATVSEYDPSTGKPVPGGQSTTTDSNGDAFFTYNAKGTYYFKAERSDSIRSNWMKVIVQSPR